MPVGNEDLLRGRFGPWFPPNPSSHGRCTEDGDNHPVWPLRISSNAIWPQKHWPGISTIDGDGILRHIDFVFVYLDDILIASQDAATHKRHLRQLFSLLTSNGISINRKKCTLGKSEVRYLGHLVMAAGITPLPERVEDLLKFPSHSARLGGTAIFRNDPGVSFLTLPSP